MPENWNAILTMGFGGVCLIVFALFFWKGIPKLCDWAENFVAMWRQDQERQRATWQAESAANRDLFAHEMELARVAFKDQIDAEREMTVCLLNEHGKIIADNTAAIKELSGMVSQLQGKD